MDLGFSDHVLDGVAVLSLFGDADMATLPRLLERVNRFAVEHPGCRTVIDLDGLGSMDPVVAGVFVRARLALRSTGGELDLVCTNPAVTSVFVRSGLDATFTLHRSVTAAVTAAPGPGGHAEDHRRPPAVEPPR
jgi:anti-anti-sigma factor